MQAGDRSNQRRVSALFTTMVTATRTSGHPAQRARPVQQTPPQEPEGQEEAGLYIISVAARILQMHPQTLRKYERLGLVQPSRTMGMLRLYSEQDIAKLRMIKHLVEEVRLNLAGVEMALAVFDRMVAARERMERTAAMNRAFEQMMDDILTLFAGR